MHSPPSPLGVASRALTLLLRRPREALIFCFLLLALEVTGGLVTEMALSGALSRLASGDSPLRLILGAAALLTGFTLLLCACGVALLGATPCGSAARFNAGLHRAWEVSLLVLIALLALAVAGVSLTAALMSLPSVILQRDPSMIAAVLLISVLAVTLAALTTVAAPLALLRTISDDGPAGAPLWGLGGLGKTLAELLTAPGPALTTIGLQALLAAPLLVAAIAAALTAASTDLHLARLALGLAHAICMGLAMLWITTGLYLRLQERAP